MFDPETLLRLSDAFGRQVMFNTKTKSYDPDRYELVEKKDWKINQLKLRIKCKKELVEEQTEKLKYYEKLVAINTEHLEKLEAELKELE